MREAQGHFLLIEECLETLDEILGGCNRGVTVFNDAATHEEVLNLFDQAIKTLQRARDWITDP